MKTVKKLNIETIKTVVIAVLITAIVAFIAGMKYQGAQHAQIQNAIARVTSKK